MAADVYAGDKGGRGGWTWYTGSAGWLYRAAVEGILGIRKQGDQLLVEPSLPSDWDGFTATLKIAKATCKLQVKREARRKKVAISVDGKAVDKIVVGDRTGTVEIVVTVPA